ncbi:MAG: DUF4291 family protein [Planctomycetaceae bacterium]
MSLITEEWTRQQQHWPESGRVIMAQSDSHSVVVYQAYRPSIGLFAAEHGYFGGDFSLSRMTWIKPNFLWMMYRSGWGTKPDQEVELTRVPFLNQDVVELTRVPFTQSPRDLRRDPLQNQERATQESAFKFCCIFVNIPSLYDQFIHGWCQ